MTSPSCPRGQTLLAVCCSVYLMARTQHFGFTDEELDFIDNYDIKYRMGRDDGADDEGSP